MHLLIFSVCAVCVFNCARMTKMKNRKIKKYQEISGNEMPIENKKQRKISAITENLKCI